MHTRIGTLVVLGALVCAALGMACSTTTESADSSDDALRMLRAGDVDQHLVEATPAENVPEKFAKVKTWSVDYVVMEDTNPDNAYRGLMLMANDANGALLYMMPLGWSGADANAALGTETTQPSMFLFGTTPDAEGNLAPVAFDLGKGTAAEKIASEKAALDWIGTERKRLLAMLSDKAPKTGSGSAPQSLHPLIEVNEDMVSCGLHAAAMLLMWNPVLYFVVDGAIDIAQGIYDNSGKEIAHGAVKEGLAGVGQIVKKKFGEKVLNRGLLGLVAVNAAYNIYEDGDVVQGLVDTAKELIPASCRKVAGIQ